MGNKPNYPDKLGIESKVVDTKRKKKRKFKKKPTQLNKLANEVHQLKPEGSDEKQDHETTEPASAEIKSAYNKSEISDEKQERERSEIKPASNGSQAAHKAEALAEKQDKPEQKAASNGPVPILNPEEPAEKPLKRPEPLPASNRPEAGRNQQPPAETANSVLVNPPKITELAPLSPRKQTIMRYKKNNEHTLINEAKGNLKNKRGSGLSIVDEDDKYSTILAQQNMEGKASLFKYESSKISVFHEQLSDDASAVDSSGRLLSNGEFEIFQLHNGDVTYLSCGRSFVYPLLPKLKLLRIGFNQFILPLVNPERYWKIYINTEDEEIIQRLENTLKSVVQYRNLGFNQKERAPINGKSSHAPINNDENLSSKVPIHEHIPAHALLETPEKRNGRPSQNSNLLTPEKPRHHLSMFADIPESPPSAPLSPHPVVDPEYSTFVLSSQNPQLVPGWSVNRKKSFNSVTSAMASLDVNKATKPSNVVGVLDYNQILQTLPDQRNFKTNSYDYNSSKPYDYHQSKPYDYHSSNLNPPRLHQPKPTKYSPKLVQEPHSKHKSDAKSDSSMDSLLDEYEENISISKSYSFSVASKPPSRPLSLISGRNPTNFHYQRSVDILKDLEQSLVDDDDDGDDDEEFVDGEEFPTTSLSEYNRHRKSGYNRSRRSSNSELYTSVSNWMEPGKKAPSISNGGYMPVSRSGQDLNQAYKNIYKSITQRNLSQYLEPEAEDGDTRSRSEAAKIKALQKQARLIRQPIKMASSSNLHRQSSYAGSVIRGNMGDRSRSGSVSRFSEMSHLRSRPDLKARGIDAKVDLKSGDVYRMLHEKKKEQRGGLSRLFGW